MKSFIIQKKNIFIENNNIVSIRWKFINCCKLVENNIQKKKIIKKYFFFF